MMMKKTELGKRPLFENRPGTTVGFVGSTGAGGHTVINLLSRFYEYQGSIKIDADIREIPLDDLRNSIGWFGRSVPTFIRPH